MFEEIDAQNIVDLYVNKKVGIPTIVKKYASNQRAITKILLNNGVKLRDKTWVLVNRPPFKGYKFSPKQKNEIRERALQAYKKDPTLVQRIREKTLAQIKAGKIQKSNTSIEKSMTLILLELGIRFEFQKVFGFWAFDFYLPEYNTFIECDGDYWHANPIIYTALNKTQKNNIRRGKAKETYAKNRGYQVLRFWESDFKHNPNMIKQAICNLIK